MKYKLYKTDYWLERADAATTIDSVPGWSFVFYSEQPLYRKFKIDVADGTPLEDPDGNVMTQEQVDEFLKEIP